MRSVLVMVVLLAQAATPGQGDPQALPRMVASERAFAAATAEIGVRDGFLAFFAEDSIHIQRGATVTLVPARAGLAAQPLAKLPILNKLIWEPYTGHVSSDGTLGWLTGGYVSISQIDHSVVSQGAYFSVWKRQANGTWRVWLDEGVTLPQIWQNAAPFRAAPEPDAGLTGTPAETIDQAEASIATSGAAWKTRLANDVRLHIDGQMPLVSRDVIAASPRGSAAMTLKVLRTEVAASNDLAVTIGTYESAATPTPAAGTWVRVWKRDATGRWRIVFQTETAK